jgi:uncharacterized protein with von Willebrand factor type A (vWA) domain
MAPACEPLVEIRDFVAYLREHGFVLGYAEVQALIQVMSLVGVHDARRIQACWRGVATSSRKQWLQFPDLFEAFWFPRRVKGSTKSSGLKRQGKTLPELIQEIKGEAGASSPSPSAQNHALGLSDLQSVGEGSGHMQAQGGASRTDPLAEKPLGEWMPHDSHQLDRLIAPLQKKLRHKLIRRYRRSPQAARVDVRTSMRKASGTAGELIRLHMKARATIPPRVFILVDVSKSMETHAQFFLRMARAFCQILNARVFVFHTRLTEVTALMKRDSGRVQEKINAVTFGFGGGTQIATNLRLFLEQFVNKRGTGSRGAQGMGRRDVVYVLSDGFDTDPPEQTRDAIRAIRQKGAELYWLHPTAEIPQSQAIQLSHDDISDFLAVSHLDSLEGLVDLGKDRGGNRKSNREKIGRLNSHRD